MRIHRIIFHLSLLGVLAGALACQPAEQPAEQADRASEAVAAATPVATVIPKPEPAGGDWPTDRGTPARVGVAPGALPGALAQAWKFKASEGIDVGAAIVGGADAAGGTVYVGTREGTLYALGLGDGTPRWQAALPSGLGAVPTIVDARARGAVLAGCQDGTMVCLDAASGKERWRFQADAEIHGSPLALDSGPMTAHTLGGLAFFGAYDSKLYALHLDDGRLAWTLEAQGPLHGAPALGPGATEKTYLGFVAGCDNMLRAVELATGAQQWQYEMPSYAAATPAIVDHTLYVGHFGGGVLALDLRTQQPLWHYQPAGAAEFPFFASCAVGGGRVFAGGRDRKLHAIDAASGKPLWVFETKGDIDAAPLLAGETLFAASKDGTLYALDAASGAKLWEFVAGPAIEASPAAAQGRLVVADSDGMVYCFKAPEP